MIIAVSLKVNNECAVQFCKWVNSIVNRRCKEDWKKVNYLEEVK